MNDITNIELGAVTGGATAKYVQRPLPPQPSPYNPNPASDCVLGALGAGMWGASPIAGCIAGATGGGGNSVLDALLSM